MFALSIRYRVHTLAFAAALMLPTLVLAQPAPRNQPQQQRNQQAGTIQFSNSTIYVREDARQAALTVQRVGGSSGRVSIKFKTVNGSATKPADYQEVSGTFYWLNGDSSPRTITVPIVNDNVAEPTESFRVVLEHATGGASLGASATATVTITDDDMMSPVPTPMPGTIQFSTNGVSVREDVGQVTLTVQRVGGSSGRVSVTFASNNGSALDGSDYREQHGTLTWENGDASPRTITIPIINDTIAEPSEWFRVAIISPTGGATLGANTSFPVVITDDDAPVPTPTPMPMPMHGTIKFALTAISVNENARQATLSVQRVGGSAGKVTVDIRTVDGSARTRSDYDDRLVIARTLVWENGDTAPKPITISITNDNVVEPTESFRAILERPTGGATIATPAATVTILDDNVQLNVEIRTGDEGFGAGNAIEIDVLFTNGLMHTARDVFQGQAVLAHSTRRIGIRLDNPVPVNQIRSIRVRTPFRSGPFQSGWRIAGIDVVAVTANSASRLIVSFAGPYKLEGGTPELSIATVGSGQAPAVRRARDTNRQ